MLGESHQNRALMDNHLTRPEVQGALEDKEGTSIRFSSSVDQDMMYGAVPVFSGTRRLWASHAWRCRWIASRTA